MCSCVEVTGEGLSQMCCMCGAYGVCPCGWDSLQPAFGHSGGECELHVECVFVTSAPVPTSSCVPVQPHMTVSSFCVYNQSLCNCKFKYGCEFRWLGTGWTQDRHMVLHWGPGQLDPGSDIPSGL